jgi:hypothetical protein
MTLAVDYPLLNLFWTILWFAVMVGWIMTLFLVIMDVFRSRDMGGWGKALWLLLVLVLPVLGVLIYLLARGNTMTERSAAEIAANERSMRAYVQDAAGGSTPADELTKLAALRDQGVITDADFQAAKARILA